MAKIRFYGVVGVNSGQVGINLAEAQGRFCRCKRVKLVAVAAHGESEKQV
jgi:hypothetical protein